MGDAALARHAAAGDPDAFAAIFARYRDRLYHHCVWMLRHPHDAEEALQGAMLSAYQALLAGRSATVALRPWLYRIAHNECLQVLRRRPGTESEEALAHVADPAAEGRAETREAVRELDADLLALPTAQRAALLLRELDGLSHDGIAHALDTSPRAVKQLIYEARQSLLEFRAGRALACAEVRRLISDEDGRVLRGRRTRAHLRSCAGCREFRAALADRPLRLLGLAPALPLAASERILAAVLGAGGGPGGGSPAGAAGATGALTRIAPVAVAGGTATLLCLALVLGGYETTPHTDRVASRAADGAPVRPRVNAAAVIAAIRRPRPTTHPKPPAGHPAARTVLAASTRPASPARIPVTPRLRRPAPDPPRRATPPARPAPRVAVASRPAPMPVPAAAPTPAATPPPAPAPAAPAPAAALPPPPAIPAVPPPVSAPASAPAQPPAAATAPETRPGNGLGDANHDHTGPPGQEGAGAPPQP